MQHLIRVNGMKRIELIEALKSILKRVVPNAQAILYGSEARGEARPDSDVDLLILLDKNEITLEEEEKITAPLYDMEFEKGIIISPIVMTRKRWEEAKRQTLFYYNVLKDGVLLQ